jgi:hypothetical protein
MSRQRRIKSFITFRHQFSARRSDDIQEGEFNHKVTREKVEHSFQLYVTLISMRDVTEKEIVHWVSLIHKDFNHKVTWEKVEHSFNG